MKLSLVLIAVFLGALALVVAIPRSVLVRTPDVMEHPSTASPLSFGQS